MMLTSTSNNWQKQAEKYLIAGEYSQAASIYEQAIEAEPDVKSHYWHLGLMLLLQEQEAEAQMVWLMAMSEVDSEVVETATEELATILDAEANRRQELEDYQIAWAIRQHIREISPTNFDNLIHIVKLSSALGVLADEEKTFAQIMNCLNLENSIYTTDNLFSLLETLLINNPLELQAYQLAVACISLTSAKLAEEYNQKLTRILFGQTLTIIKKKLPPKTTIKFAELCLELEPNHLPMLLQLSQLFYMVNDYIKGAKVGWRYLENAQIKEEQVAGRYLIVRCLMRAGGYWQEAEELYQTIEADLKDIITSNYILKEQHIIPLMDTVVFANYFRDEPRNTHLLRTQVAKFCCQALQNHYQKENKFLSKINHSNHSITRPLKIGYVSSCLRQHSVGWLTRWLFKYHDQSRFQTYVYFVERTYDPLQEFIAEHAHLTKDVSQTETFWDAAQSIVEDEIDILVDLDSVTSIGTSGIMALKPAPVQITWLGSDASDLPTIDYFIADNYVLPESAQKYYASKIWRLPNTYIAVDGFEVDVPTLKREDLGIEEEAVVYMSAQVGYKRHPDTAQLQMKIIKEVPNSYFLIKGLSDQESIQRFFYEIAETEGVTPNRLKFLGGVPDERIHRANLGIADVILDTYPYNGATTTLETLWMGIPLVTKVGEQFAARNSYGMMVNAGITEGIAWTDEEYVEWGIRLGKNAELRKEISWKLRKSRQTAPLWNAKQFTREMERAYEQMWMNHLKQTKQELSFK